MGKTVLNKLLLLIYLVISALILEAVTFYLLDFGGMPKYFWYDFAIIFFIALLIYAIPNYTAQFVLSAILLAVQTILIYTNYSLTMIYGDLFSFDMFNLMGEAVNAVTTNFIYFSVLCTLVTLYTVLVILGTLLLKYVKRDKIDAKQHYSSLMVILLVVLQVFSLAIVAYDRDRINKASSINDVDYYTSDAFLMNSTLLKKSSYETFGTYGYYTNLVLSLIAEKDQDVINATISYFNNGNIYDGTYYVEDTNEIKENGVFGIDSGNNVIMIMMESLEWFAFGDGNYDNTLSNLSNELTPNIYSLIYDDSLIGTNFFAKSKTNISESYAILGMYPIGESLKDIVGNRYDSSKNTLGYSMPSILRDMGYTTTYLHSNKISFYNRGLTHGNLGFDNVIGKDSIRDDSGNLVYSKDDLKWNNWAAEEEIVTYAMDYIVPKDYEENPFYTFYLNVSSHGAYTEDDNEKDGDALRYYDYVIYGKDNCVLDENNNWKLDDESKRNNEEFYTEWYTNILNNYEESDPSLVQELVYYQCGAVGLDAAIGKIIEKLQNTYYENGESLYDNTTIVLFSDHYSYYDNMSSRVKRGVNESGVEDIEVNTIPFILSSPGLREIYEQEIGDNNYMINDRFMSAYDIIPTLFDLMGIEFNENFYVGRSLYSPVDYHYNDGVEDRAMIVYYSNTGGIFSEDIFTYDLANFTYVGEENEILTASFISESYNVLEKINYLTILNRYELYNEISNK